MMQLLRSLSTGLLQLLVIAVLLLVSQQKFKRADLKFLALFCLLFLFDAVITSTLNLEMFPGQQWNWAGKTASLCWAVIFINTTKLLSKKETGWTLKIEQRKSVFLLIAILLLLRLGLRILLEGFTGGYKLETFCYEATLPGLSEELVFRGILLGLLNKVFPAKWKWLNASFGWGLILTAVLFGLVHSLSINEHWQPHFSSQRFFSTGALGFVLGLVKEKAKSLTPAVLLHNLWNLIAYWGQ